MIDMHTKGVGSVLDMVMWSNITFCVVATCTRASGHMSICQI